jgi:hypothetical protein
MKHTIRLAILAGLSVLATSAYATKLYATTDKGALVSFDSSTPGTIDSSVMITGLQSGETVLGIDFRPNGGSLYALGSSSRLYKLNRTTGVATQVGSVFSTMLMGNKFGFDFNPTVDRIRVVSDMGQNLRLNPITGAVAAVDTNLAYAGTDVNAGMTPNIVGSAYTRNFVGGGTTTLYNIDSKLDVLTTQVPPNAGTLNTVGSLGIDVTDVAGFDIAGEDLTFAALHTSSGQGLYSIDLMTGNASLMGAIGGDNVTSLAAVPEPGTMIALGAGALALLRRRFRKS